MPPSDLKSELLRQRYLAKDENGRLIETPERLYQRIAAAIAAVENKQGAGEQECRQRASDFYRLMVSGRFLPNSPTLMNAGRKNGLLSACFVVPVADSIEGIFNAVKHIALIQKAGGGTGFTLDRLRPTGDRVASSGGATSGPLSFWRVLSEASRAIQQGAHRRGANMAMMSLTHPDILKFITAKQDPTAFTNFNISVKMTDDFMRTLHQHPDRPHIVINPRDRQAYRIPKAVDLPQYTLADLIPLEQQPGDCYTTADLWRLIVSQAHATGEPGLFFIDRVNQVHPVPHRGIIEAANPCGEQPLLPYESCNLGSLNLAAFVRPDGRDLDWDSLASTAAIAVRFLDNVIDANHWPLPEVEQATLANRKIGLGVMGLADALVLLGIRYDSEQAVTLADRAGRFINDHAHRASRQLAEIRGTFPNWPGSIWDTDYQHPMRNATCTTIAPTGSISILAGCSSGIEPIYKLCCQRIALDGEPFLQIHPLIEHLGQRQGWLTGPVRRALCQGETAETIAGIPPAIARVLVTAHEIAPAGHVRIQAAFQNHTDNAVSKTVNLPASAAVADVEKVFQLAYDLGCKGITVYRDSSRAGQILAAGNPAAVTAPRLRPRVTAGSTRKFRMGCGTLYVTVNRDEQGLCEVFANLGKAGGCPSQTEATCRAVSAALRAGVDVNVLIEQLSRIRCLSAAVARKTDDAIDVLSCPDAIAQALKETVHDQKKIPDSSVNNCPECDCVLRKEAGCQICDNCGYTKCG